MSNRSIEENFSHTVQHSTAQYSIQYVLFSSGGEPSRTADANPLLLHTSLNSFTNLRVPTLTLEPIHSFLRGCGHVYCTGQLNPFFCTDLMLTKLCSLVNRVNKMV